MIPPMRLWNAYNKDSVFLKYRVNPCPWYEPRSEVEFEQPYNTCALQTIRRLVSLGFTLNVLKKIFWMDPTYEIPSCIFLHNMSEVQKLRVHSQTNMIRHIIKQYFVNPSHINGGHFSVIWNKSVLRLWNAYNKVTPIFIFSQVQG